MTATDKPITIKKYANRRLYNTGTSTYVTLEDLAGMVKRGEDFAVFDAKTGEEITRSVLAQIIFEQEGKNGQSLLPTAFLRQLIRFYGDSMQMLVPSYLEFTIDKLTTDQHKMREQVETAIGGSMLPGTAFRSQMFDQLEEQTRKNMLMFSQALTMFSPFTPKIPVGAVAEPSPISSAPTADDLEALRTELSDMQKRLDRLAPKPASE
ncbi:polyhydroxyalkanoate synthesis repressor PhaR [Lichenihabitans sp. PAMC28606]|uniref:polyhydroxyalkanoate synthesis repressor PhaR n=1 Tax=Lichenihabitans sp. PAMC28606 TaxID=2880932 RepID=UPI001D0AF942|nr:polyhydroxyalkanoate synthesis repressor PhaR [Lichenihabitans sp. PAMC28606]UDL93378.1 polyhydroxyalkanoate synthesis repressor PhaR [Lichenihabitans sp. PAMC28606]